MPHLMKAALLLAAVLLLAACAAKPGDAGDAAAPAGADAAEDELVIEVDRGDGSAVERYTLICGETPGGDHPDAQAACAHLSDMDDPFAALPADAMCAQVYAGPETAHVTGRWQGRTVDLELGRNDACRSDQWDSLGPVLSG